MNSAKILKGDWVGFGQLHATVNWLVELKSMGKHSELLFQLPKHGAPTLDTEYLKQYLQ